MTHASKVRAGLDKELEKALDMVRHSLKTATTSLEVAKSREDGGENKHGELLSAIRMRSETLTKLMGPASDFDTYQKSALSSADSISKDSPAHAALPAIHVINSRAPNVPAPSLLPTKEVVPLPIP